MEVNDRVKVLECAEDNNDNATYADKIGTVVDVKNDPLISVKFDDGTIEGFWIEELRRV